MAKIPKIYSWVYVVSNGGDVCFRYETGRDDDNPGYLQFGRLAGRTIQSADPIAFDDIQSLVSLPSKFEHKFLALDGDGRLIWIGSENKVDKIAGAGFHGKGAKNLGRMANLVVVGQDVFALGYGGQVYKYDSKSKAWRFCSESLSPQVEPEDTMVFSTAIRDLAADKYIFAGTLVGGISKKGREMIAKADRDDDSDLYVEAMLNYVNKDRGVVWQWTSKWEELPSPTNKAIIEIFRLTDRFSVLSAEAGTFSTADFKKYQDHSSERPKGRLLAFLDYNDQALLAFSDVLYLFDGKSFKKFGPSPWDSEFFTLAHHDQSLLACCGRVTKIFEKNAWNIVDIIDAKASPKTKPKVKAKLKSRK